MYVNINKAGKDRAVIEFIKKSGIFADRISVS